MIAIQREHHALTIIWDLRDLKLWLIPRRAKPYPTGSGIVGDCFWAGSRRVRVRGVQWSDQGNKRLCKTIFWMMVVWEIYRWRPIAVVISQRESECEATRRTGRVASWWSDVERVGISVVELHL